MDHYQDWWQAGHLNQVCRDACKPCRPGRLQCADHTASPGFLTHNLGTWEHVPISPNYLQTYDNVNEWSRAIVSFSWWTKTEKVADGNCTTVDLIHSSTREQRIQIYTDVTHETILLSIYESDAIQTTVGVFFFTTELLWIILTLQGIGKKKVEANSHTVCWLCRLKVQWDSFWCNTCRGMSRKEEVETATEKHWGETEMWAHSMWHEFKSIIETIMKAVGQKEQ